MTDIPPTAAELDAIEELCEKATPGRWFGRGHRVLADDPRETIVCEVAGSLSNPRVEAGRDLIASLHNALPSLLAGCRRALELEAELAHAAVWHCGCGNTNGINLSRCAVCDRRPGGER